MSPASFVAAMTPEMPEAGLDGGTATVTFAGDRLKLHGATSGALEVQLGSITGMRAMVELPRGYRYRYLFTLFVGGKDLRFATPPSDGDPDYGRFLRALTAALLTRRIPVSTGLNWAIPVIYGATLGVGFIAAALMSILLADDEELYLAPLGVLGVIIIGSAAIAPWLWRRIIPRPVSTIAELERALPGC